jgi:ribosomal protein L17
MLRSVTAEDMKAISDKLVDLAKDGNVTAAREVMDRCLGKSCEVDLIDRIEHLERIIAGARAS